jgi:hypothetical protein
VLHSVSTVTVPLAVLFLIPKRSLPQSTDPVHQCRFAFERGGADFQVAVSFVEPAATKFDCQEWYRILWAALPES